MLDRIFSRKFGFLFRGRINEVFSFSLGDNLLFRGGWSGVSEFALIEINIYLMKIFFIKYGNYPV